MSHLVLARKYRPKNFAQMVGQGHVVQALGHALGQQRLHHAYLFTGTRGVGKTTVSRILAKSLNCVGPDGSGDITPEPCGVCPVCQAIDAGRFVDYVELDAASNRGVDEIQSLLEQAVYKPVQGRFKVFMIDEVHMLSSVAFNAMLKTLEEPPPYLKFVLATTDPHKVPVTVLSRCLQFSLRPMTPETIADHLVTVLDAEQVPHEPAALRRIAKGARGSMRDALSLTDQALAFGGGAVREEQVRQMLGAVDKSWVFRLVEALAVGDGRAVFEVSGALRDHGLSAAATLEDLAVVLQRMAVCQLVADAHDVQDPEATEVARLARLMPADETQLLYSMAIHGRSELGLAPDEYTGLTMTLLRLLAFKPKGFRPARSAAPASAPIQTAPPTSPTPVAQPTAFAQPEPISHVETAEAEKKSPATTPDPSPSMSRQGLLAVPIKEQGSGSERLDARIVAIEPDAQHEVWVGLVQQLLDARAISALAQQLAVQSQCVEHGVEHIRLRVEQASLKSDFARDELQAALQGVGRHEALVLEIGPVQDSWARRHANALAVRQKQAEALILQDPWVQMLMDQWGAKIVPGSIQAH